MSKRPENRYQSAREFAEDLLRFQTGALVHSYSYSPRELLRHYYRKHRAVLNTAAAGLAALLLVAVVSYVNILNARNREHDQRILAEQARDAETIARQAEQDARLNEEKARLAAEHQRYIVQIRLAQELLEDASFDEASAILDATNHTYRGWEWNYLHDWSQMAHLVIPGKALSEFTPNADAVIAVDRGGLPARYDTISGQHALDFHADQPVGQLLTLAISPNGNQCATATTNRTVLIWNLQSGQLLHVLTGHEGFVNNAAYSADGALIATASDDGDARLWSADTGNPVTSMSVGRPLWSATLSADAALVVLEAKGGEMIGMEAASGRVAYRFDGRLQHFSSDRRVMATIHGNTVDVRTVLDGRLLHIFTTNSPGATVKLNANGKRVAVLESYGLITVGDTDSGSVVETLHAEEGMQDVAFSPDDHFLAACSGRGRIFVWNLHTGALSGAWRGHGKSLRHVAFSPDGASLLSAAIAQETRIWPQQTAWARGITGRSPSPIRDIAIRNEGEDVAVATDTGLDVFSSPDSTPAFTLAATSGQGATCVALAPDGRRIATVLDAFTPVVWDWQNQLPRATLSGHDGWVFAIEFSPDGKRIMTGSWDCTARVWDAQSGATIGVLNRHTNDVRDIAFSHDGRLLATASADGTAILWNAHSLEPIHTLDCQGVPVIAVAFSQDDAICVTGSQDGMCTLWETAAGQPKSVVDAHTGSLLGARFIDYGRLVTFDEARGSVWDVDTGALLVHVAPNSPDPVFAAATDARGTRMVFGSYAGSIESAGPIQASPRALPSGPPSLGGLYTVATLKHYIGRALAAIPHNMDTPTHGAAMEPLLIRANDEFESLNGKAIASRDQLLVALQDTLSNGSLRDSAAIPFVIRRNGVTVNGTWWCMPELPASAERQLPSDTIKEFVAEELYYLANEPDVIEQVQRMRRKLHLRATEDPHEPLGVWFLNAGSPVQRAQYRQMGIAPGDLLTAINGQPVNDSAACRTALQALLDAWEQGAPCEVTLSITRGAFVQRTVHITAQN